MGQAAAKRAVAVALRNRWRRQQTPVGMRGEITPKNILMIGPTGVGKTEIARRLAKLANAPFVKVEATKFTEVGYVGKDVDTIIRDLVEVAIKQTREQAAKRVRDAKKKPKAEKPGAEEGTEAAVTATPEELQARVTELEAENERLRMQVKTLQELLAEQG